MQPHNVTLINGNSTQVFDEIVNKLENKQIIVVSDPPFNVGYKYKSYKDNLKEEEYYDMLNIFFSKYPSVVIHYPEQLYKLAFKIGKIPERVVSWVYNSNTPRQHRDVCFFDVKPNMNQVKQPYKNLNDKRIQERIKNGCEGGKLYDWWEINQVKNVSKEKTSHPCQMPLEVMERIIGVLPYECVIIDPFMGSGTTGVAVTTMNAKQNANREFIGIELDEEYFNISKERIEASNKEIKSKLF